jgi:zinc transporter ZupT
MSRIGILLAGADSLGYLIAALLYLRIWNRRRDYFFAAIGGAFVLLSLSEFVSTVWRAQGSDAAPAYVLCLIAFGILLAAIAYRSFGAASP